MTVLWPRLSSAVARLIALRPLAQTLLMVVQAVLLSSPAPRAAWRTRKDLSVTGLDHEEVRFVSLYLDDASHKHLLHNTGINIGNIQARLNRSGAQSGS